MPRIIFMDANDKVVGRVMLYDGMLRTEGVGDMVRSMKVVGAAGPLTPADGDAWLMGLMHEFRTPYLRPYLRREDQPDPKPDEPGILT